LTQLSSYLHFWRQIFFFLASIGALIVIHYGHHPNDNTDNKNEGNNGNNYFTKHFFFVLPWLVSIPDFYKKEKYERKRKITMMQTETRLCLCGEVEDEEGTWAELL
jgi:hypothetical protein